MNRAHASLSMFTRGMIGVTVTRVDCSIIVYIYFSISQSSSKQFMVVERIILSVGQFDELFLCTCNFKYFMWAKIRYGTLTILNMLAVLCF